MVAVAQLHAAGYDGRAITRGVVAGRLHRVYRGVYAVGHRGLAREGKWMAAVLAAGEGAALSHLCAAALWELRRLRTDFVTVVAPKERAPRGPVRVHVSRALDPRDVTARRAIPVTTVARTLVDLSDVLTPHQLANVIHEAAFRERFDLRGTWEAIARAHGRRRLRELRRAIDLYLAGSAGTKSRYEDAFLRLVADPEPLVNTDLLGEEVDFHWPRLRLVVEVDGEGHDRPPARRDDARRDALLRQAGYTTLRFTGAEVERHPREVLGRVRTAQREAVERCA